MAKCLLNYLWWIAVWSASHAMKFWTSSVTWMNIFYVRIATISGSLLWVWNDSLHVLYTFNDSRPPWVPIYNGIILWLADGDLLYERETGNSHDHRPWLLKSNRRYSSCKLLGTCLRNIFQSICLIFTWDYSYIGKNLDGENLVNFSLVVSFTKF